jgi:hypothetical protein
MFSCGDPNEVLTFTNAIVFSSNSISEVAIDTTSVSCVYSLSFQEIRGKALEIIYARETVTSSTKVKIAETIVQDDSLSSIITDTTMLPGEKITLNRRTSFVNPGTEAVTITWLITGVDAAGNFENFAGEIRCE